MYACMYIEAMLKVINLDVFVPLSETQHYIGGGGGVKKKEEEKKTFLQKKKGFLPPTAYTTPSLVF